MRILKFILAFVVTGVALFALVIGLNWQSFDIFLNNREAFKEGSEWVPKTKSLRGLTEFIDENPQHVSVASIVSEHPDSTLLFNEDTPRTLGTLSNIFILTAYAIEIDEGNLNPEERLSVDDITTHRLPKIDNSVHSDAFQFASEVGWLDNGNLPLNRALELLAHFNDPVLADFLWWKLQPYNWDDFKNRFDLNRTDMPLPYSGLFIHISIFDHNSDDIEQLITDRETAGSQSYRELIIGKSEEFLSNSDYREEIYANFEDDRLGRSFMEERDALQLFPQGTAHELALFMQKIWTRDRISENAASQVLQWLRSPYAGRSEIDRDFTDYGAIFDSRIGLLNGIDFGTLVYTGETKFQAVIFDRLPVGFWFHMSGNHMHQDFQQRLIYDPALIDLMTDISNRHNTLEFNEITQQ